MSGRNPLGKLDVNDDQMFHFPTLQTRGNKTMEGRSTAAESLKNTGRWTEWERITFLKGLRLHGRGHWKKISSMIPTRNTIQIKTHAQVLLRKYDEGEYIYDELDRHYQSRQQQQMMAPAPILPHSFNNRPLATRSFSRRDEVTASLAMLLLSRGEEVN